MPSKHGKASGEPPEILQHLGRAALAYGISRLTRQESSKSSRKSSSGDSTAPKKRKHHDSSPSSSSSKSDSKSKSRHTRKDRGTSDGHSATSSHRSSRSRSHKRTSASESKPRGPDNNELHHHMSQLAAGVLAFGVQRYMHHRHERKRQKSENPATAPGASHRGERGQGPQPRGLFMGSTSGKPHVDPELSAALASLDGELQGTAEDIGRLARKKPDHRDCEVHRGLVDNEARLRRGLDGLRSSVNNVRNLHPGVAGPERVVPVVGAATGRKREERARKREAEARIREAEAMAKEGKRRGDRPPPFQVPERDARRERERERPGRGVRGGFGDYEQRSRPRDDWERLGGGIESRWRRW